MSTLIGSEVARFTVGALQPPSNAQATRSFGDGYRNRFNRVGATAFMMAAKLVDVHPDGRAIRY